MPSSERTKLAVEDSTISPRCFITESHRDVVVADCPVSSTRAEKSSPALFSARPKARMIAQAGSMKRSSPISRARRLRMMLARLSQSSNGRSAPLPI